MHVSLIYVCISYIYCVYIANKYIYETDIHTHCVCVYIYIYIHIFYSKETDLFTHYIFICEVKHNLTFLHSFR